jgi:hypothetical protein
MNLARAVQVSIDTAMQPCEDWKVNTGCWIVAVGRWAFLWVGAVIVFAMAWGVGQGLVAFDMHG